MQRSRDKATKEKKDVIYMSHAPHEEMSASGLVYINGRPHQVWAIKERHASIKFSFGSCGTNVH